MTTHTTTRTATVACAAATLIALPTAWAAAPDGSAPLPGGVRVWELNHPEGITSGLLPGDVRVWELNHPEGITTALRP